jgi:hypothetical protein
VKLVAAGIVLNISKVLHRQYVPVLKNHRDGLRELSGRYLKKCLLCREVGTLWRRAGTYNAEISFYDMRSAKEGIVDDNATKGTYGLSGEENLGRIRH